MDINQNQQINTFTKGMNTDTSDFLLQNEQYRYAENIRIVTDNSSNTGEIHLINGNESVDTGITVGNQWKLLSMDSIRDIVVFVIKEDSEVWSVRTYNTNTRENHFVLRCQNHPIWENENVKELSTVLRWESEDNVKLYIANGKDPLLQMQINKTYGDTSFDQLFKYTSVNLPAPTIETAEGGALPSAIVQYAYRLYSENNSATTISALSKPISLYNNSHKGYGPNKITNKSVKINVGEISSNYLNKIQVYRISYQQKGQLPVISLVSDRSIQDEIIDNGRVPLEEYSVAEFIALYNIKLAPHTIESKGDYLFLGNVSYMEDFLNDKIEKSDVRCFSKGNYFMDNGVKHYVIDGNGEIEDDVPENLCHDAFQEYNSDRPSWSINDWGNISVGNDSYNGVGKYFAWRYKLTNEHLITPQNQVGQRTYRRNEIYRFGVRFFDKDGNVSSVKWLCDILMPPMFQDPYVGINIVNGETRVRELGIEFHPINQDTDLWDDISAYEIVQCERTLSDQYTITQGICGKACSSFVESDMNTVDHSTDGKTFTPSGFFSLNDFELECPGLSDGGNYWPNLHALSSNKVMMFASPEYVYQPDDIKDVLNNYKTQIKTEDVVCYLPKSEPGDSNFSGKLNREDHVDSTPIVNRLDLDGNTTIGPATKRINGYSSYNWGIYSNRRNKYFYNPIVEIYNTINPVASVIGGVNRYYFGTNINAENSIHSDINTTTDSAGSKTVHYFNYYIPQSIKTGYLYNSSTVHDVSYADSPDYSGFAKNREVTVLNSTTNIKNDKFINWTNPVFCYAWEYGNIEEKNSTLEDILSNINESFPNSNDNDDGTLKKCYVFYPTGSGGRCVLFEVDNIGNYNCDENYAPHIFVRDIVKPAIPYRGYNEESIQNSTYLSVGAYAEKYSDVDIYQGDTFLKFFTYNAQHEWFDANFKRLVKSATVYAVPLETSIDIQAQFSDDLFGVTSNSRYVQDKASVFDSYSQSTDAYLYNTAYSIVPNVRTWYPDLTTEGSTNNFDTRVHYSGRKINNEKIDNWMQYKSVNFLDVDSRYGEITSMKLFKDKLIFWQDHATGLLSVNERVIINDINDTQLQLGTGGVLERFDYLSQIYGMKKYHHASAVSNDALYWWDGYNKEILQYSQGIVPLSSVKNITNYIKSSTKESDIPTILYDDDYKEIICNVVNDESVVYSEYIDAFQAIYKEDVQFWCNVLGSVYESKQLFDGHIYKHNSEQTNASIFNQEIFPKIKYIVNTQPTLVKVFDIQTFGGRFYGGDQPLSQLKFNYFTPLKQASSASGEDVVTNLEYDYRLAIPRNNNNKDWGDRMRGKTMQCEFKSDSNNTDFSLQYVITKFRMSWT